MRVAIVGSRDFGGDAFARAAEHHVREYVMALPTGTIVVSGGARGVDSWAEGAARLRGLELDIHPAKWRRPDGTTDKSAGFRRNALIAAACDRLVAFRCVGKSNGTDHVVGLARKAGKPIEVWCVERDNGFAPRLVP